jgi:hypothetical protein
MMLKEKAKIEAIVKNFLLFFVDTKRLSASLYYRIQEHLEARI